MPTITLKKLVAGLADVSPSVSYDTELGRAVIHFWREAMKVTKEGWGGIIPKAPGGTVG